MAKQVIMRLSRGTPVCNAWVENRWYRRQGTPQLPRNTSGGGSSDWGSEWSSHQSSMTRGSRESN